MYESVESWLATKELEGCSVRTLGFYRDTADMFADFLGRDPETATTDDVRAWLQSKKATCSNVTLNNYRRNLNSYYNFLEDEDIIRKSPMRRIHHIREVKAVKVPFSPEDVELMYEAAGNPRDRAIVAFLASSGVRVSELVGLDADAVDLDEREAVVFGKGGKERVAFFDVRAKIALEAWLAVRPGECEALFCNLTAPHARMTYGNVERVVAAVGVAAGVEHAHPHRFRRTVATSALSKGMKLEEVQAMLGHSQVSTTLIYAQVAKGNVKEAHRRFV